MLGLSYAEHYCIRKCLSETPFGEFQPRKMLRELVKRTVYFLGTCSSRLAAPARLHKYSAKNESYGPCAAMPAQQL